MSQSLTIKNAKILQEFKKFESSIQHENIKSYIKQPHVWDENQYDDISSYCVSDEYLNDILASKAKDQKYSFNCIFGETATCRQFLKEAKKILEFDNYYTSAYVPKGFVGWHTDAGVANWFIMFTYSPLTSGYFRWRDPDTGVTYTDYDAAPWIVRSGYTGSDTQYWHCCKSIGSRYTIILSFDSKEKKQRAVDQLLSN